jgi:hypothetical protein
MSRSRDEHTLRICLVRVLALLAAGTPLPVCRNNSGTRKQSKRGGKPPRLSVMYNDEQSANRALKARESSMIDAAALDMNDDEFEPPDVEDGSVPFPEELIHHRSGKRSLVRLLLDSHA